MYNEEAVIPPLRDAVERFAATLASTLELVLVNDGSTDDTLSHLAEWAGADSRVRVLHLSRNFGHQIAATASHGWRAAKSTCQINESFRMLSALDMSFLSVEEKATRRRLWLR